MILKQLLGSSLPFFLPSSRPVCEGGRSLLWGRSYFDCWLARRYLAWLVGWLVGWLLACLVDLLVSWLVVSILTCSLARSLACLLAFGLLCLPFFICFAWLTCEACAVERRRLVEFLVFNTCSRLAWLDLAWLVLDLLDLLLASLLFILLRFAFGLVWLL